MEVICLTIFSGIRFRKEGFSNLNPNILYVLTIQFNFLNYSTMHATMFWILFPNEGFGFKTRDCRIRVISNLFFKILLEGKCKRFKIKFTLSMIFQFNLRLGNTSYGLRLSSHSIYKKTTRGLSTS